MSQFTLYSWNYITLTLITPTKLCRNVFTWPHSLFSKSFLLIRFYLVSFLVKKREKQKNENKCHARLRLSFSCWVAGGEEYSCAARGAHSQVIWWESRFERCKQHRLNCFVFELNIRVLMQKKPDLRILIRLSNVIIWVPEINKYRKLAMHKLKCPLPEKHVFEKQTLK